MNRALGVLALLVGACGGDDGQPCTTCLYDALLVLDGAGDAGEITSDAPVAVGCPATFMTIAGGQGAHRYRLINATADWAQQVAACSALTSSAYVAIPDDAVELAAIATLSAASASWVGISDVTEGAYLTVKGVAATYLPWDTGQPDDAGGGGGEDCAMIQTSSSKLRDEKCSTKYRAVCECEP